MHCALAAVGLTVAFATAFGEAGLSCNVVAGYFHDHIFVGHSERHRAKQVLRQLATKHRADRQLEPMVELTQSRHEYERVTPVKTDGDMTR